MPNHSEGIVEQPVRKDLTAQIETNQPDAIEHIDN